MCRCGESCNDCRRIRKLHAKLDSASSQSERETALKKIHELLNQYGRTWNDIAEILAAIDAVDHANTSAPQQAPTEEPESGINVLDLVIRLVETHIAITPAECMAVALWILHTYVFDRFRFTPRLAAVSPVRGAGKSTLMALIEQLVAEPHKSDDISPAAVYHQVDSNPHTCFIIDEGDNADLPRSNKLRAVFNSGHERSGAVTRFMGAWSQRYSTFAPLAIAAIGILPLPLLHRSILINMQRRPPEIEIETLNVDGPEFSASRELIQRWASTCRLDLKPEIPAELSNRPADNWRVLLAIADNLGHGTKARSAALELNANRPDEDVSVVLLGDIRAVFLNCVVDRITSEELIKELPVVNDLWADWRDDRPGRKLTQGDLARLLRPFRIRSKSIWPIERTPNSRSRKGYTFDQFESAWRSYCSGGTAAQPKKTIHLVGS